MEPPEGAIKKGLNTKRRSHVRQKGKLNVCIIKKTAPVIIQTKRKAMLNGGESGNVIFFQTSVQGRPGTIGQDKSALGRCGCGIFMEVNFHVNVSLSIFLTII
jgi:hypothetical protein